MTSSTHAMPLFRLLWQTSHRGMLLAIFLGFISGLAGVAEVALINNGITGQTSLTTAYFVQLTALLALVYAATILSKTALIRLTEQAYYSLQLRLARQVLAAPVRQIEEIGPARLLAMLSQDNDNIASFFQKMPLVVLHSSIIIACIIYLYVLSPELATLLLLIMIPAVLVYMLLVRRGRRWLILSRRHSDKLYDQYRAMTEGAKELKQHQPRRLSFFYDLFEPASALYRYYRTKGRIWHEVGNVWSQILFFIFVVVMLLVTSRTGLSSPHILTGFALVALYMRSSVASLVQAVPTYNSAVVALAAIARLRLPEDDEGAQLHRAQVLRSAPDGTHRRSWSGLEARGIRFAYFDEGGGQGVKGERRGAGSRGKGGAIGQASGGAIGQASGGAIGQASGGASYEVGPIDLSFHPGELVFIAGGNGSGKTTLLKLLCGLYTPDEGQIWFDGRAVDAAAVEAYRQNFSVLFADFYLFDELLGLDPVTQQQKTDEYLALLQLEDKVTVEDGHFSTSKLSFGQRKRLALLTAYLEDRPIYIFDEWAAGQDPTFSDIFYHQLLPDLQRQGRLVIVVTHDDHYYPLADRLIKMEHGRIEYDQRRTVHARATADAKPEGLS